MNSWVCVACGESLVETKVQLSYLGSSFTMAMLTCPRCKRAMVTEEMALCRMAEAEQVLEDK